MAKERNTFPLRMEKDTADMMDMLYEKDNCQSKNEFINKALNFYISYLTTNREVSFLNPMLYSAMKASLKESENRQAGNMFRLAVEMSVIMNVIASALNVNKDEIKKTRGRCVQEVKESRGRVSFEDAIEYND